MSLLGEKFIRRVFKASQGSLSDPWLKRFRAAQPRPIKAWNDFIDGHSGYRLIPSPNARPGSGGIFQTYSARRTTRSTTKLAVMFFGWSAGCCSQGKALHFFLY